MITITQKIIIVFLLLLSIYSHSQCVVVNNSIPHQTSNNCNTFLADFIPHPNDPAVEVSLMIWVFNETNGTGLWSSNTVNNADAMIAKLNINYSSLQPPNFVVSGVANIQNSKISFSRKGFQKINNSSYFHDYDLAIAHYYDPSAINIYFIEDPIKGTSVDGPLPHNAVSYNTDILFQDIGNLPSGNLEHELGHALGLEHTWLLPQFYFNGGPYSNTNENCCPTLVPNDYHQEYLQNPSQPYVYLAGDEWGLFGNCNALGPLHSNNIMGYNAYCRNYLSPLQMALMHYNLRTNFTNVLTTNSYNNHLVRNPSLDYIVQNGTGGETWTTNRYFKGNITVKSGNKLEILCKVGMAKNTYIIVEKGAQLVIGSGGELTNISCQYWGGISVQGSTNLPQIVNGTTGFAANQGVVRVINGGKISNAENGIKNYTTYSNGNIDWSSRGGVIVGNGGVFENNVRDVEFISYHNSWGNDYSTFTNCQFLTTKNSQPYPFVHVTMWDVRGVQFKGCNFEYTPTGFPLLGTGILSMDATYYVDQNGTTKTVFKRLKRGIYVLNANPLKLANIRNTIFSENWHDGVFFKNMNFALFEKNELISPSTALGNGLYLHSCQNYKVKLNEFHEQNYNQLGSIANGLYAYNSQGGAHEVYKNKFYYLGIGVNVMDKNSSNAAPDDGLKINCNDFSFSANGFDVALTKTTGLNPPTVMREQGNISAAASATNLVRNIYGATCNNQENQWYVDPSSGWKIVDHGSNTQSNTQPLPQPSCSGYLVHVVPQGFPLVYNDHCKDYPGSSGGLFSNIAEAHDNLNNYLANRISANNNNSQYFEIQATLASKINLFLTDTTAASGDSVVAVLQSYWNYIADADIQLVFAYMRNSNYGEAQTAINSLDSTRNDWATLLDFMLDMEQDSMKYYRLLTDSAAVTFLEGFANEVGRDGRFVAQNILHFVLGMEFEEPRTYLEQGGLERRRSEATASGFELSVPAEIKLYPNPGNGTYEIDSEVALSGTLLVFDLFGRKIFTEELSESKKVQIFIEDYSSGIYLIELRAKDTQRTIYKEKLIKQD